MDFTSIEHDDSMRTCSSLDSINKGDRTNEIDAAPAKSAATSHVPISALYAVGGSGDVTHGGCRKSLDHGRQLDNILGSVDWWVIQLLVIQM